MRFIFFASDQYKTIINIPKVNNLFFKRRNNLQLEITHKMLANVGPTGK